MSLINDALNRAQADKQRAGSAPWGRPLGSVSDVATGCDGREAGDHAIPRTTPAPSVRISAPLRSAAVLLPMHFGKIKAPTCPPPLLHASPSCAPAIRKPRHLWLLLLGTIAVAAALGYRFYDTGAAKPQSAIGQIPRQLSVRTPAGAEDWGSIIIRPAPLPKSPNGDGPCVSQPTQASDVPGSAPLAAPTGVDANLTDATLKTQRTAALPGRASQQIPAPVTDDAMTLDAPTHKVDATEPGDVVLEDLTTGARVTTNPPSPATAAPTPTAQPSSPAQLKLAGIIFGPEGAAAIISGRSLRVGQEICGAKVVKITHDEVALNFHGQTITLRL